MTFDSLFLNWNVIDQKILLFSMFMSLFFLRRIFIFSWNWIILFVRKVLWWIIGMFSIIVCVILIAVCFILLDVFFNILSNFIVLGIIFFIGLCLWTLLSRVFYLMVKQSFLFYVVWQQCCFVIQFYWQVLNHHLVYQNQCLLK